MKGLIRPAFLKLAFNNKMDKSLFKRGARDSIPIFLAYVFVSMTFGLSAVRQGLKPWQAILISMTNLTSAGQHAAVPIIVLSGSLFELLSCQFIINLRYALMSVILSQKFDNSMNTIQRVLFGFAVTDEIFALAVNKSEEGPVGKSYLYGLMPLPWIGWSLGTAIGGVAGDILPSIITSALGIAIYGFFISIVMPEAKKYKPIMIMCLVAIALSILFHFAPVLKDISEGFTVIICSILAAGIMTVLHPFKKEELLANEG